MQPLALTPDWFCSSRPIRPGYGGLGPSSRGREMIKRNKLKQREWPGMLIICFDRHQNLRAAKPTPVVTRKLQPFAQVTEKAFSRILDFIQNAAVFPKGLKKNTES